MKVTAVLDLTCESDPVAEDWRYPDNYGCDHSLLVLSAHPEGVRVEFRREGSQPYSTVLPAWDYLNNAISIAVTRHSLDVLVHLDSRSPLSGEQIAALAAEAFETAPVIVTPRMATSFPSVRWISYRLGISPSAGFTSRELSWDEELCPSHSQAVGSPVFAYSVSTLSNIGGWNGNPQISRGGARLGLSLRAAFAACPIRIANGVTIRTEERDPQNSPGFDFTDQIYASKVVFSPQTWSVLLEPWFKRAAGAEALSRGDLLTGAQVQQADFVPHKQVTDSKFLEEIQGPGSPGQLITASTASSSLYFVASGLGNLLMCIPAIKALARLSGEPVDVVDCGLRYDASHELLALQPFIGKVLTGPPTDQQGYRYRVGSFWALPQAVPLFGASTVRVNPNWGLRHEVDCNMEAIRSLGYKGPTPNASITIPATRPQGVPADYVVIGTGCGSFELKRYPHWRRVCELLISQGVQIVFAGAAADSESWFDESGTNLTGKTTLLQTASLIHHARHYVGIDNGLSHLAAAVNTPSTVLYGPSADHKNRPWSLSCRVLKATSFSCMPCWGHPRSVDCRYAVNHQRPCMLGLPAEYVAGEILTSINLPGSRSDELSWHGMDAGDDWISLLKGHVMQSISGVGPVGAKWMMKFASTEARNLSAYYVPEPEQCAASLADIASTLSAAVGQVRILRRDMAGSPATSSGLDAIHLGTWSQRDSEALLAALRRDLKPGAFLIAGTPDLSSESFARAISSLFGPLSAFWRFHTGTEPVGTECISIARLALQSGY